jgi:integrase
MSTNADESADLAEFMGFAGLGQAETSSLTWGDVNLEKGQIVTFRHKTKQGFAIPIFPQLRPLLVKRWALAIAVNAGNPPLVGTRHAVSERPWSNRLSRQNNPGAIVFAMQIRSWWPDSPLRFGRRHRDNSESPPATEPVG